MKSKKILLFVIALIGTFMINIKGVFALDISVSDVKVNKKGGNISLGDTSFNDKNINSSIEFNDLNDYVIYQITLKNNDSEDYTIDSIKDNNTNENISVSYSYDDKKISSKGTQNVYVTLKYNKKLYNKDSISLNDLTFTLNLLDSKGNSKSTIINPITGDSILRYILLFIISLILIFFGLLLIKRRKSKLFLVFLIALIPSVVFAKKNLSISIRFTNITIKGEMLPYTVTIKDSNGTSTERTVVYGQPVGNLPEVSKVGYTFDKYEDQDGNEVTEDTIVKGNLTVTPKFNPITYDITYDYAGGNASNPEHYTIEDDITLSQPTRNGYTFLGWTGTNINTVQNSVRIQNSTGNLNFVAHWSTNQNTPYRVIHKYQKLDGTYEEVVQNLEGPTDEEVTVALLNRDGFTGPQQLTSITIIAVENEEDIPTVTYTYTRNNYSLTLNDDIETTFTKPSYPYGTEITLTAKDKDNYEFIKWSNGETTKTITFNITGNTEIYPIYSRIKYTVTYDPMNGEISPTSQEVNAGESITTLPIPTAPTGKSFDGWYTEETGGSKVNDGYTPTGNITLYARYYTDISGSTITPSSISVKVGETSTIVVNDIEEEYTFESSDTNIAAVNNNGVVTGTGVGTTTITITGTSSGKTKTIDVTVTQSKYTVTYNAGEGTISPTTQEVNVGSSITTLPIPTAPTGKSFDGWYTEETGGNKVNDGYTPTGDITLYARYSVQSYTVSFNTNGGSNVSSQTIEYGGKATRPTTDPTKTNYTFVNWYADSEYNTLFDFNNTTITSNTIVYAKFKQDTFPVVFSEPGECTFNGSDGVLTGTNCSYANGTNKYIDTGINLYNTSNHDKDYEIGFTIVSYDYSENVTQATFMNTKLEGNNYPGLVFRKSDKDNTKLDLSSRKTSSSNERKYLDYTEGMTVKLYRIYNEDLDTQEIFYSINDEDKVKINNLSQFNPTFDLSVWFGAAPTNASATSAQRILVGTMKDMYIKLGTYEEDNSEKYIVTFNANGGSVTPTSKRIDIDSPIGTLPTPTAPTGKTFIGWYTELNGGEAVTSSYMPNTNKTIYARYYKDVTGATVSPSSISILNGASETLSISNVEEEYTFSSNNTNIATVDSTGKVTGTGVGTTTITITGSSSGKTKTVNVTVESSTYTVTLNPNGGTLTTTSITQNKGTAIGELPTPTAPTGKEFDGWYTGIDIGEKVTSSYMPNSNVTIYARYVDDPCKTFATDSWSTIRDNLESDSSYYAVGCEKEVEMDMNNDGTNESYTVRLANTSTPEVCETEGFSQTACGTVIEFVDVVEMRQMNSSQTNAGGWKQTAMVTYLNGDFYNKLPVDLKSIIIPTYPIVSGSGKNSTSPNVTGEDIGLNKMFLLSRKELRKGSIFNENTTRTLDFYVAVYNPNDDSALIKKDLSENEQWCWTRMANPSDIKRFFILNGTGVSDYSANFSAGVAPAFRIGTMPSFTVSFDTDEGSSVTPQTITYGEKATKPTNDPTKTGLAFDNWYTDDTYTTVFDFDNTVITSNTTIYAHFIDPCKTFATDSWSTIKNNLESDSNYYAVGCEKEIELDMDDDGTNESYTVRLANTSTPEVCEVEGYSQTACGLVIEFVDSVAEMDIDPNFANAIQSGWIDTNLVKILNNEFYNKLPEDLKTVIIPTYPIVSGSGTASESQDITIDDSDKNRIYLLSTREIGVDYSYDNKKDITTNTRTLDFYVNNTGSDAAKKNYLNGTISPWWLRTTFSNSESWFVYVINGSYLSYTDADTKYGIAPAFRIGSIGENVVSFNTNGGNNIANQLVVSGHKVVKPDTPLKSGYIFDNWYTDSSYSNIFDFENTIITSDKTLYAKWSSCQNFSSDSWSTIKDNIDNNPNYYPIGCEKEVELDMDDDGNTESYTVRLVNTSTGENCSNSTFSQTSCGTVIEFKDIITTRGMNNSKTSYGGWKSSAMIVWLNNTFYNKLPNDIKDVIIPTYPIISGSGYRDSVRNVTEEDTNKNKVFLLAAREVGYVLTYDNRKALSQVDTLDYYKLNDNYNARIKRDLDGNAVKWWLRSAHSNTNYTFYSINKSGGRSSSDANVTNGVAPAFRIGTNN